MTAPTAAVARDYPSNAASPHSAVITIMVMNDANIPTTMTIAKIHSNIMSVCLLSDGFLRSRAAFRPPSRAGV